MSRDNKNHRRPVSEAEARAIVEEVRQQTLRQRAASDWQKRQYTFGDSPDEPSEETEGTA